MTAADTGDGTTRANLLAAALAYSARGLRVVPLHTPVRVRNVGDGAVSTACSCRRDCGVIGKHPRLKDGLKGASAESSQIRRWWEMWPDANVGVCTGRGLLVLDIDADRGGRETLDELVELHGELPETVESLTGGGGSHLLFSYPSDRIVPNGVDRLGQGVDIRADGGYIVAPPSMHASGRAYAWEVSSDFEGTPIAEAPAWVLTLASQRRAGGAGPRVEGDDARGGGHGAPPDAVHEGGRNDTLYRLACSLRSKGLGREEILAALLVTNARRCVPPLDEVEVERIVDSACKHEAGHSAAYERERTERQRSAEGAGGAPPAGAGADTAWLDDLARNTRGVPRATFANLCLAARSSAELGGKLRFNEMTQQAYLDEQVVGEAVVPWVCERFELRYRIEAPMGLLFTALEHVARERAFHPVQDFLNALPAWDGESRIARFSGEVLGAAGSPLESRLLRCFFLSAVARAMQPGCDVHTVLVFVGGQGAGKSRLFRVLAGEWFNDSHIDITNKDAFLQIASTWLYEWGEVEKLTRARFDDVKAFVTSPTDTYRPPYGRKTISVPRSSIFVGSTNEERFLADPTGARRWWPVSVGPRIDVEKARVWRDQVWAEALAGYQAGEKWHLSHDDDRAREAEAERYRIRDPWEDVIGSWIANHWPEISAKTGRRWLTAHELLVSALGMHARDMRQESFNRVGHVMKRFGYVHKRVRLRAPDVMKWKELTGELRDRIWAWVPKGDEDAET